VVGRLVDCAQQGAAVLSKSSGQKNDKVNIISQVYCFGETETADGALKVADANDVQRLQTNGVPHAHVRLKLQYSN
jgi:hypothetical protein